MPFSFERYFYFTGIILLKSVKFDIMYTKFQTLNKTKDYLFETFFLNPGSTINLILLINPAGPTALCTSLNYHLHF